MLKKLTSVIVFLLLFLVIWFSFYSDQPHHVIKKNVPLTEFSTLRAFHHVQEMAKEPHFVGSNNHSLVRNYIVDELQKMGLQVQTQEGYNLNREGVLTRPQNILARIKGEGSGKALLLMAHYDSAVHSSLGASDDASGVATILEGIRAFLSKNEDHKNDIIILISDAEELGLNGASLFMKEHPWAKDVGLAINFEARGSGGNSFMLLETNGGNAALIGNFIKAHPQYPVTNSLAYSVYKMLPNDTDLTVLREQGNINGFNFAFIGDHFDYHTANDTPANLDKESLAQQGSYLMPLLEYFKDKDLQKLNSDRDLIY
ncbi:MAG: M20/M25/M40 family metallo-hydrolase, partial [Gillisia sp.]